MDDYIDVDVFILPDGTLKFLYYDELKPLLDLGDATVEVKRASHVDPEFVDGELKWFADLISGPKLGPFNTRDDAIAAEVEWLVRQY